MLRAARSTGYLLATLALVMGVATAAVPARAGSVATADVGARHTQHLRLGVPAYWSPDTTDGTAMFQQLVYAVPAVDVVVVNGPHSAPPDPFDPRTAATIARLHREGATVLAYVDSGYLGLTGLPTTRVNPGSTAQADWVAQIGRDIDDWYHLYGAAGLDGVFVDQTPSSCGQDESYLHAYQAALGTLLRRHPEAMVAMNPGMATDECYTDVADALVIFENTYAAYLDWTPPAWVARHPARQFWHLVYDAPSTDAVAAALGMAAQRHAGYVYVTDRELTAGGSPWGALPAYWDTELNLVSHRH